MRQPARTDLLELTPGALMALANPGFVKRAQRELDEGPPPAVEEDPDGTVRARYGDGHCAVLPPGRALREASCTCPASGLCRHRVALVLAYQRWATASTPGDEAERPRAGSDSAEPGPWSPADFAEADLAGFAAAVLAQAARLAASRPAIRVTAWSADAPVPTARLPMCTVRFFSRDSLAHARCDCRKVAGCEHVVLAVWAFRQAPALPAGNSRVVELAVPAQADAADGRWFDPDAASPAPDLDALLLQLWLDGSSQPPVALDARIEAFRQRCEAAGWRWVVEAVDELRRLLADQHQRVSSFDPVRLLHALAELPARLLAARQAERLVAAGAGAELPANLILGVGIGGEVPLDHLRLVSLGAECWQGDGSQGVRIAFADPDSQQVMVLDRSWPVASGQAADALMARRITGTTVRQLACAQVVTKAARRRANGAIAIAASVRQTSVLSLGPQSWDTLGLPLRQPDARALASHLQQAHPDFVRPKQAIEHLHVLPVAGILDHGWDAAAQTLHARIGPENAGAQDVVHLLLQHDAATPGAVDAMAAVLSGQWGAPIAVAGLARIECGRLLMRPLSFLTAQRAVVLTAEQLAKRSLPLLEGEQARSALDRAVQDTFELLASWLRQGLRHLGGDRAGRGARQVDALRRVGLVRAGARLQQAMEEMQGADRSRLPMHLAGLVLLLDGTRRTIQDR